MTKTETDAIRARCVAATPGPWVILSGSPPRVSCGIDMTAGSLKDAYFILHAREDIPKLLDALETAFEEQIESKNSYNDLSITYDLLKQHSERLEARRDHYKAKTEELRANLERETAAHTLKNALIADLEAERDEYKTLSNEFEKANDCLESQLSALRQLCELHKIMIEVEPKELVRENGFPRNSDVR